MKKFRLLAFDTETIGLSGDAIYVSWCDGRSPHGRPLNRKYDLTDWLIEVALKPEYDKGYIVAHNGLRFDFARIDWRKLLRQGYTGRVFTAKNINAVRGFDLKKGKQIFRFRDSITFFPGSLADFSGLFAPDFKKHFKWETNRQGERYKIPAIDFEKEDFDSNNPAHVAYALRDAEALFHSCQAYDDFLREEFDVTMMDAVTLSGVGICALRKISKEYEFDSFPALDTRLEDIFRSSYHGGFVCAFQIGRFKDCLYYDVNSAYAYIMKTFPMPAGHPVMVSSDKAHDLPALQLAAVDFKNAYPYLISRPEDISGRFSGKIAGWFWDFEIELQRRMGAEIKIFQQIVFPGSDNRLFHFIRKCEELRHRDYTGPMGQLAKLLQNSVYGKFGSAKHKEDIVLSESCPHEKAFPLLDDEGSFIPGIWSVPASGERLKMTMVHWSSYITARVRWLDMNYLLKCPFDSWIYTDTDAFIITGDQRHKFEKHIGKQYGDLKLECEFKTLDVYAPKVYQGEGHDGKRKTAAKGIPRSKREIAFGSKQKRAYFESSRSFMFNLKGKLAGHHSGKYTRNTHRTLSGAHSIQCGTYENGRWVPELATQDLDLVPGLHIALKESINRYLRVADPGAPS